MPTLLLPLLLLAPWSPQASASQRIQVTGNKRTQTNYIVKLTQDCLQTSPEGPMTPEELQQCLLNAKIFTRVQVSMSPETLDIQVEERWTLIPLPFARSQKDSKSVGLFLMESNFLGQGKLLGMGASLSSDGHTLFLLFRDPTLFLSSWNLTLNLRAGNDDVYFYERDTKIDGFHEKERSGELSLGRKLSSTFNAAWTLSFSNRQFDSLAPYATDFPDDRTFSMGPTLTFQGTDFKFYFQEGLQARMSFLQQVNQRGSAKRAQQFSLSTDWQRNLLGEQALQIHISLQHFQGGDRQNSQKIGGRQGLRGVPQQVLWARTLIMGSVDYQIPIFRPSFGTWTLAPFMDLASMEFRSIIKRRESSFSYGIGGYLFLTRVAFPGLGLVIGRNDKFLGTFTTFSIGRGL